MIEEMRASSISTALGKYLTFILVGMISGLSAANEAPKAIFDAKFTMPQEQGHGWNFCQVTPGRIGFGQKTEKPPAQEEVVRRFLINKVDADTSDTYCYGWEPATCPLGGSGARTFTTTTDPDRLEELESEPMGPSFILGENPSSRPYIGENAEITALEGLGRAGDEPQSQDSRAPDLNVCPSPERGFNLDDCKETPVVQRNEMRLASDNDAIHPVGVPHWYRLDFRMDGVIPSCGSVRWVIGQWKYKKPNVKGGHHQSPFLAQRFDNGVFHVTVQSHDCRCLVAKAEGDFQKVSLTDRIDRLSALEGRRALALADEPQLSEVPDGKLVCLRHDAASKTSRSCRPANFKILTETGDGIPRLPDPKAGWTRMLYRVKGGPSADGQIDIYANGAFVARVEGLLGYETEAGDDVAPEKRKMKFKIGQYRDKIPYEAALLLERVCIADDARGCLSEAEEASFKPVDGRWK